MSENKLIPVLRQNLATAPAGGILVALSGGLDSTVLLHALAVMPEAKSRGLRAIHIDHGLHAESASWATHCAAFARKLDIPFLSLRVQIDHRAGQGIEAAARNARYAAIVPHLAPGELLAVAQHRDDQTETVLLKLLRGAGPEGLGGMRELRSFAHGYLWRPLLALPRAALRAHAYAHGLHWIEDPSNNDNRLSRNFLRNEILPGLRHHWPDADVALSHSANWNRSAADFILDHARRALAQLQGLDRHTLRWREWLNLPDALRDPVLRLWLRDLTLPEPSHAQAIELQRQIRDGAEHTLPCVRWIGVEMRRYRELLYAMRPLPHIAEDWQTHWHGETLGLPGECGQLSLRSNESRHEKKVGKTDSTATDNAAADNATRDKSEPSLRVRFRRGGESLKPVGGTHTRELRLLFQESGIPPWQRARTPLIFAGKVLLAVGDLWLSEAGAALFATQNVRVDWQQGDRS